MFKSGKARLFLLLLVLGAVILYMNIPSKPAKETVGPKQLHTLEKTGAGTVADYTAAAQRIHTAVDSSLAGAKLAAKNVQEGRREVASKAAESTIRWHARQLLLPAEATADGVSKTLTAQLLGSGGEVLGSQSDTYQGQPAVRVDVGIRDTLGGEQLTLITDRIFIPLPKKPDAAKPAGQGRLAVIIDDFGYSAEPIAAFASLPRPVTFAVIPYRPYSNEAASRALAAGQQVMLHLPMEPQSAAEQSESSTITVAMSDQEIRDMATKAIQSVPGLVGVNNHQGSRATADRRVMRTVLGVIKANNLFFVDSHTSAQSVAYDQARQMGIRTGINEVFLDNRNDVDYIKGQLRAAVRLAIQDGSAIAIGHARPATAIALREMIGEIEAAGVKLVFVSQLVK